MPWLLGLVFLAPDFNTRLKAPPPCPGSSPVGGCGFVCHAESHNRNSCSLISIISRPFIRTIRVLGMAELFNFSGGSFPWTRDQLQHIGSDASTNVSEVVLITHQPFRCREGVPDWYFCFSSEDKASLRVRKQTYVSALCGSAKETHVSVFPLSSCTRTAGCVRTRLE